MASSATALEEARGVFRTVMPAASAYFTMDELLAESDIIVLCAPGGEKPLVDGEAIGKMKEGVVIINVSRGSNVDEAALLEGLRCRCASGPPLCLRRCGACS